jgi:hypothetical protein
MHKSSVNVNISGFRKNKQKMFLFKIMSIDAMSVGQKCPLFFDEIEMTTLFG